MAYLSYFRNWRHRFAFMLSVLLTFSLVTPGMVGLPTIGKATAADVSTVTSNTYQLAPMDDVFVQGGKNGANNYNTGTEASYLRVKKDASADNSRQSFLKFNVSELPTNLLSAKLYIYGRITESITTPVNLTLYDVPVPGWQEEALTWNTKPELGTPIRTSVFDSSNNTEEYKVFDLTEYIQAQMASGRSEIGIGLYDSSRMFRFFSKESANPPYIEIVTGTAVLAEVSMEADKTKLGLMDQAQLTLKGKMNQGAAADLSKAQIVYTSDKPEIATVDSTGKVTPVGAGKASITALVTMDGVSLSASVAFTVVNYSNVLKLNPSDDAYVRDGTYAGDNLNTTEPFLRVKDHTDPSFDRNVFLKYNLNSVQGGIISAKLRMYGAVTDSPATDTDVTLYTVVDDNWQENTVTWRTKPAIGEQLLAFHVPLTDLAWYEIDVTEYLKEQLAGDHQVSFGMADSPRMFKFADRTQAGLEPHLEIISFDPNGTPMLANVELNSDKVNLGLGDTAQLTPIAQMTNGSQNNLSQASVVYTSSNPSVLTVSPTGAVNAISYGKATVTIKVTLGDVTMSAQTELTVAPGVVLLPVDDATVKNGAEAGQNFGSSQDLMVKSGVAENESLLKFDLTSLQGRVTGAKLYVYGSVTGGNDSILNVNRVTDDSWKESSVTWNSKPGIVPGDVVAQLPVNRNLKWNETDITSSIQSQMFGDQIASLSIGNDSSLDAEIRMNSKDHVKFRPFIKVQTESVSLVPISQEADKIQIEAGQNASVTVTVKAEAAQSVKAFDVSLNYNADLLTLEKAELGEAFGPYRSYSDLAYTDVNGALRIRGGLIGNTDQGVDGQSELVKLTFRTKGKDGVATFVANGSETKVVIAKADVTGGGVAIDDVALVARAFGKSAGQPGYDAKLDMNKDGSIDKKDLDYVSEFIFKKNFTAPIITMDSKPETSNTNTYKLNGKVNELAKVKVNGKEVALNEDFTFQTDVILADRVTLMRVEAVDADGNESVPVQWEVRMEGLQAVVKVSDEQIGKSMKYVGYNQGHYMPGSNTSGWVEYSGVNAMRFWASPQLYTLPEDVDAGAGMSTVEDFDAKKAALRSNPEASLYINWASIRDKIENMTYPGTNKYNIKYVLGEFERLNITPVAMLHSTSWNDSWAEKWQQWQKYYAMTFIMSQLGDVEMYAFVNEPNHSNQNMDVETYIRALKIASDAIRTAIEDVNRLKGKHLTAHVIAPGTAGSPEGLYGQQTMQNLYTDYHDRKVASPIFDTFANQQYSNPDNFFGEQVDKMKTMMKEYAPNGEVLPIIYTEFGRYTTAVYDRIPETLDTPYVLRDIASIYGTTMEHGVNGMMAFKFSNTVTGTYPNGYKSGHHYVSNEGVNNIRGTKRTAEVVRLFAKGFKDERPLYKTDVITPDVEYKAYTSYDSVSGNYYIWMPQPSDTEAYNLVLDLADLDVAAGTPVTIEEVSEQRIGEVVYQSELPNSKQVALKQPKQSAWLITIPKGAALSKTKVATSGDAYVEGGTSAGINFGHETTMKVRLNESANGQASYIQFNPNQLNPDAVKRAFLNVEAIGEGPINFHIYGFSGGNWNEQQLTWANAPHLDGATGTMKDVGSEVHIVGQMTVQGNKSQQVDVTDFIQKHSEAGKPFTFVLIRENRFNGDSDQGRGAAFATKDAADSLKAPTLELWQ